MMRTPMSTDEDKTPPGGWITPRERGIVNGSLRSIVKTVVPFLPKIAASAGPALVVWLLALVHASGVKDDTDKQVKAVEATTERAVVAVAQPANKNDAALAAAVAELAKKLATVEATQKAQAAREGDFVVRGVPARARRRVARELAAKAAKDVKPTVAPVITPIPLNIPPPPPEKKDSSTAPVQGIQPAP